MTKLNYTFGFRDVSPENALLLKHIGDTVENHIENNLICEIKVEIADHFIIKRMKKDDIINVLTFDNKNILTTRNFICILLNNAIINLNLKYRPEHTSIYYSIYSNTIENTHILERYLKKCFVKYLADDTFYFCDVKWFFNTKSRGIDYSYITELFDDKVYQEAYPYFENLEQVLQDFIKSEESIFLLIGPPGTGKTRLIRYIIQKLIEFKKGEKFKRKSIRSLPSLTNDYQENEEDDNYTVSYTTESEVIKGDEIFMDLFNENSLAVILEDIDYHLKDRKIGDAPVMYKLLGASSGLVKNINKKIFLSTNLDNINDIDEALLRPGRCFGVFKTRKLIGIEAQELCKKITPDKDPMVFNIFDENEIYSVAQVYKYATSGTFSEQYKVKTVGFKNE